MSQAAGFDISVTLGGYKGISVDRLEILLSEEAVDARAEQLLAQVASPESVTSSIREGDLVTISFEARMGKKSFKGSQCKECHVPMGRGLFIPGFEEHLYSHKAGDQVTFTLNFPSFHVNPDLAGRLVKVDVHIHKVERTLGISEMDDEYISSVSEFYSMDELKDALRIQMEMENQSESYRLMRSSAIRGLAQICEANIPEEWIEGQYSSEMDVLMAQLKEKETSLEEYLADQGLSEAEYAQRIKDEIIQSIKGNLALRKIAELENLQITEEDEEQEAFQIAQAAGISVEDVREMLSDEDHLLAFNDAILREKAIDFVLEHANYEGEVA